MGSSIQLWSQVPWKVWLNILRDVTGKIFMVRNLFQNMSNICCNSYVLIESERDSYRKVKIKTDTDNTIL